MNDPDAIRFESHPPERRRRSTETLMCGCCCCCCCCLHTVGGLIGAAVAPAFGKGSRMPVLYYYDEEYDISVPNIGKTGTSAVQVFWLLSLVLGLIGGCMGIAGGGEGLIVGLVILALVFPAVQLAAGLVVLIWLALSSRSDRAYQLKQTGKIILGLFVGAGAGIMAMVAIGVLLSHG
jgi:hypothetical protein